MMGMHWIVCVYIFIVMILHNNGRQSLFGNVVFRDITQAYHVWYCLFHVVHLQKFEIMGLSAYWGGRQVS